MIIEVGRFPDKRLKAVRKHRKIDSNVRIAEEEISIVSKIDEVELEKDVIEAVNLWNLMYMFPDLKKEITQLVNHKLPNVRYS